LTVWQDSISVGFSFIFFVGLMDMGSMEGDMGSMEGE
jgi:hypothetical protein